MLIVSNIDGPSMGNGNSMGIFAIKAVEKVLFLIKD